MTSIFYRSFKSVLNSEALLAQHILAVPQLRSALPSKIAMSQPLSISLFFLLRKAAPGALAFSTRLKLCFAFSVLGLAVNSAHNTRREICEAIQRADVLRDFDIQASSPVSLVSRSPAFAASSTQTQNSSNNSKNFQDPEKESYQEILDVLYAFHKSHIETIFFPLENASSSVAVCQDIFTKYNDNRNARHERIRRSCVCQQIVSLYSYLLRNSTGQVTIFKLRTVEKLLQGLVEDWLVDVESIREAETFNFILKALHAILFKNYHLDFEKHIRGFGVFYPALRTLLDCSDPDVRLNVVKVTQGVVEKRIDMLDGLLDLEVENLLVMLDSSSSSSMNANESKNNNNINNKQQSPFIMRLCELARQHHLVVNYKNNENLDDEEGEIDLESLSRKFEECEVTFLLLMGINTMSARGSFYLLKCCNLFDMISESLEKAKQLVLPFLTFQPLLNKKQKKNQKKQQVEEEEEIESENQELKKNEKRKTKKQNQEIPEALASQALLVPFTLSYGAFLHKDSRRLLVEAKNSSLFPSLIEFGFSIVSTASSSTSSSSSSSLFSFFDIANSEKRMILYLTVRNICSHFSVYSQRSTHLIDVQQKKKKELEEILNKYYFHQEYEGRKEEAEEEEEGENDALQSKKNSKRRERRAAKRKSSNKELPQYEFVRFCIKNTKIIKFLFSVLRVCFERIRVSSSWSSSFTSSSEKSQKAQEEKESASDACSMLLVVLRTLRLLISSESDFLHERALFKQGKRKSAACTKKTENEDDEDEDEEENEIEREDFDTMNHSALNILRVADLEDLMFALKKQQDVFCELYASDISDLSSSIIDALDLQEPFE